MTDSAGGVAGESDEALLQEELSWRRPRYGRRSRPAGANAISAFGIAYTLVLWVVTFFAVGNVSGLGAIGMLVVLGIEMLIAAALAGRTWVAIGPGLRAWIRPMAVFGPFPLLIGAVIAVGMVVAVARGDLPKSTRKAATKGENWEVLPTQGVPLAVAESLCESEGARIPSREDLRTLRPRFEGIGNAHFWLEQPAERKSVQKTHLVARRECTEHGCALKAGGVQTKDLNAYVLCLRDAPSD